MNPLRKLGVAFGAALALSPVIATGTAQAFELVEPQTERRVELVVGTGQLIRVDEEFSSLFVANPAVADIEVKSPRLLYLTGVGVGETTLFAVDDNDNVLMSTVIRVTHNIDALQEGLRRISQAGGVTATTVDQSLVLTGTVNTPEEAANAVQVANQFVDDPTRVVNRMNIQSPTQVNLQVRIVEVARNVDRRLGIQWGVTRPAPIRGSASSAAAPFPKATRRASSSAAAASASTCCCRRSPRRVSSPSWPSRT